MVGDVLTCVSRPRVKPIIMIITVLILPPASHMHAIHPVTVDGREGRRKKPLHFLVDVETDYTCLPFAS